jgi:hypothetical protein
LQNTGGGHTSAPLPFRISNFQTLFLRPVAIVATGFSEVAFRSSVPSAPKPSSF